MYTQTKCLFALLITLAACGEDQVANPNPVDAGLCQEGEIKPFYPKEFIGNIGVGECQPGYQMCGKEGEWRTVYKASVPSPETCNNLDDDCDGKIDEDKVCGLPACDFVVRKVGENGAVDLSAHGNSKTIMEFEVENRGAALNLEGIQVSFHGTALPGPYQMEDVNGACCIYGIPAPPTTPLILDYDSGLGGSAPAEQTSSFRLLMDTDRMPAGSTFDVVLTRLTFADAATGHWCRWSLPQTFFWKWSIVP